jgi:hypothetical protein
LEDRRLADRDAGYPLYRTAPPTRLDAFQAPLAAGLVDFEESALHHRAFEAATPTRRHSSP